MKVIDIMQKVANKEIFKFRIDDVNYYVDKSNYICEEDGTRVEWYIDDEWLNMNAEVIGENKKVKKIDMFDYFTGYDFGGTNKELLRHLELNFSSINDVLNKVIDKVNELEDK